MSDNLGYMDSYVLIDDELNNIQLKNLFPDDKPSGLRKLFINIIDYNLKKNIINDSFPNYFFQTIKTDSKEEDKNNILNTLRVVKSNLNKYLNNSNYSINKNYEIVFDDIMTFSHLSKRFYSFVENKKITDIKIFDTYTLDKKGFYNDSFQNKLKKILENSGNVSVISVFDNLIVKNFYKDILKEHSTKKLKIKYIRKPTLQASSLLYILFTDNNNNQYIFYYEEITKWSLLIQINNSSFSKQFFKLLGRRFNHFFDEEKILEEKSEIITVDKDLFNYETEDEDEMIFQSKITTLIKEIANTIELKNQNMYEVEKKVKKLLVNLKKIHIVYPNMKYSNIVLHYYIRLIEIINFVKKGDKKNTKYVINQLVNHKVTDRFNDQIRDIFLEQDVFLFKPDDMPTNISNIKRLKIEIQAKSLTVNPEDYDIKYNTISEKSDKTLSDIYESLNWNSANNIRNSFNKIIENKKLSFQLINTCIQEPPSLTSKSILIKYIVRIILTIYTDIKFNFDKNSEEYKIINSEKDTIKKLKFYNDDIKQLFSPIKYI